MTFIVPASFTVYGVPQRERRRCLIQCDVVELVREQSHPGWKFRRTVLRGVRTIYTAYVRLPGWITPPEGWPQLETGEIQLGVPMHFNPRIEFPQFPDGADRMRLDGTLQLRSEPC
jgi:hypothetical protein